MKHVVPFLACLVLTSTAPAEPLTPDAMRADFVFLRDVWSHTDRSLSAERRPRFEQVVAEAMGKADKLTPAGFSLEVARAVAVAGNGHSEAHLGPHLHGLPIGFAWFADGLHVIRAQPRFVELLGARVETVGSLSLDTARDRVAAFIPGTKARVHQHSAIYLRILEVLQHIGASPDVESAVLGLRMPDGRLRRVRLGRETAGDPSPVPDWMAVVPAPRGLPGRWTHVLDRVAQLPAVYDGVARLERRWLQHDRVIYIRSNHIFGTPANRYELFAELMGLLQVEVAPRRPKYAVVDLRLNQGGDFLNTVNFAHALPRLIPEDGRIFVLVGPDTFSAALVTAAMLKGQGGQRVVLVGETMGDNAVSWAEGVPLELPHSKLSVGTATKKHDWGSRCTDISVCYWASTAFGSDGVSLEPQIRIETRFADYAEGRDPVLDAALAQMVW
jgi:hypothetical protein